MKKNLLIALAVCVAAVTGAIAQPNTIRVNIPYPVVIGNTTLPAGDFVIRDTNNSGSSSVVLIRSDAGPAATMLMERTKELKRTYSERSTVQLTPVAKGYAIDSLQINGQEYQTLR